MRKSELYKSLFTFVGVCVKARVKIIRISTRPPRLTTGEDVGDQALNPPSPAVVRLVEGRPATLRCTAVGGYPQPSLQVLVDDRVQLAPGTSMSTGSTVTLQDGAGRGLRLVTVTCWWWTVNYRARPSDDGAQLKCLAAVPGLPAVIDTVQLSVDCE